MIIRCPQCSAQYRYDEARFGGASRTRVKCPKCGRVFEVTNPVHDADDSTYIGAKRSNKQGTDPDAHQTDQVKLVESESPELPQLAPLPTDYRFSLAVIAGSQAGTVFPISKPRIYMG
ncbi:MAG: zinc-ribbon domain-containing protein, partial [Thermoanaerobaculales bacterium]|nr:zinc-ribbon domain-containing protein [Thermoanaerobaculales bacterium]